MDTSSQPNRARLVRDLSQEDYHPLAVFVALLKAGIFVMQNKWGRVFTPTVIVILALFLFGILFVPAVPAKVLLGFALGFILAAYLFVRFLL